MSISFQTCEVVVDAAPSQAGEGSMLFKKSLGSFDECSEKSNSKQRNVVEFIGILGGN